MWTPGDDDRRPSWDQSGAHLEEIKDHLGHASIRTTSDRYGHLYDAARDRLRDHLEDTYTEAVEASIHTA